MRYITLFFALLCTSFAFCENKVITDSIINSRIKPITSQVSELEKKLNAESNINDKTFNSLSTQISASSNALTFIGTIFSLVAVAIGVYVTYVERKISKISQENKDLLSKNQNIKKEVEDLNKLIQNDIYGLFKKIKRQETIDILTRLKKIPKDILNVNTLLVSRDLLQEDFVGLKEAYSNLDNDIECRNSYKILFFQHFLTNSLNDEILRTELTDFIPHAIRCSFENDILKSTHDFVLVVVDLGINNFRKEANNYFQGLSVSEFKNNASVYTTMFESLKTRQNRFDFINLIESKKERRIAKINLGKLLIKEYSQSTLTETESLTIQEIEDIEKELIKEKEEAAKKAEETAKVIVKEVKK